ncbi:ABC transporter substrate-binding protein [Treponema brennaborense]|uniref:Extracellular solute-binding protein family 1 n=1 Tax=Treponema brennaborense (strain DSM 12168 / CIP 105900 / DD5/3) TaxID=906968 RepID=F4LNA6_TREBD|nr:extracellular solute-binding protein [Treponema brennaborense]AEE16871.1 extracellular solute-binding protein family 1 [Treponema brennaborense DSM 12168]
MKKICAGIAVLLCCLALFAAGGKDKAAGGSKSGITEITFWDFPNFNDATGIAGNFDRELIKAFEAKNPDIKVNLEMINFNDGPAKIETALASNTAPDVVYDAPGRIIAWGNLGVLAPLDDIVNPVKATIESGLINGSTGADGKIYMYPVNTAPFVMAFNKTMLQELGLLDLLPYTRGDRSWTVAEYEKLLTALRDKLPAGSTPGVFFAKSQAGDQGTRAFMVNLYGADLLNDNFTQYVFNDDRAVKNMEWVVRACKSKLLMNGSALASSDAIDMFVAGKAAHTILYSVGLHKTNATKLNYNGKPFDVIYMPYPCDAKAKLEYLIGGPCVFDNGDPARIEAAKRFVTFMAQDAEWSPKVIDATGTFACSSRIHVATNGDSELEWNAGASKFFGPYYNTINGFTEMRTYWFPMLQDTINGGNVKNALNTFASRANATLK